MLNKISLFFFLWCSLTLSAQRNLHKENIASNYRPNDSYVHPNSKIYHEKDSSSLVFYEVNLSELQFAPNADSTVFEAKARIHFSLYVNYKAKNP